jgi:GR25 family glycosyltransferase involved in LPS biosynthesis
MYSLFDKIYCINLDSRPEKWENTQKELAKVGMQAERVSGVVPTEDQLKVPGQRVSQLGCSLSHIKVIKDAIENNYDTIMVFEDDVEFMTTDLDIIQSVMKDMETLDWGMYYWGCNFDKWIKPSNRVENIGNNSIEIFGNGVHTTHAYSINKSIYNTILEYILEYTVVDLFYEQGLLSKGHRILHSKPMLCKQREGYSDIIGDVTNYDFMVKHYNEVLEAYGI